MDQPAEYIRTCYDTVARDYAERYAGELAYKPLDRELLGRFAAEVGGHGEVCDLGCGPGQTTAYLHRLGVHVCGLDLSAELLKEAVRLHPEVRFEQGNMLALPRADGTVSGAVAFYAIVHFSPRQLRQAVTEFHRVLRPGGRLLLAFHIGEGAVHVDRFLDHPVSLDFSFFSPADVSGKLTAVGFDGVEVIEREPYPGVEHPSRRAYVFATRVSSALV